MKVNDIPLTCGVGGNLLAVERVNIDAAHNGNSLAIFRSH